jgi:hypothetical protein
VNNWREELVETIKSKDERESEEKERRAKRITEALKVAEEALRMALEGLKFTNEQLKGKKQPASFKKATAGATLAMHDFSIDVKLRREDAVLEVSYSGGRPKQFDFAKDRHLAASDVEEYVGRRALEMARAAQKANPW